MDVEDVRCVRVQRCTVAERRVKSLARQISVVCRWQTRSITHGPTLVHLFNVLQVDVDAALRQHLTELVLKGERQPPTPCGCSAEDKVITRPCLTGQGILAEHQPSGRPKAGTNRPHRRAMGRVYLDCTDICVCKISHAS